MPVMVAIECQHGRTWRLESRDPDADCLLNDPEPLRQMVEEHRQDTHCDCQDHELLTRAGDPDDHKGAPPR